MAQDSRRPFGRTPAGEDVELLRLGNGVLTCELITWGCAIRSLTVPDRNGKPVDVVLGYDTLEEYLSQGGHFGAVVGRYANRIAGGKFTLNGKEYSLFLNNGPNHLHGGKAGFSKRVWTVERFSDTEAVLSLDSPDGDQSYPGHLTATVTIRLDGGTLEIDYRAVTDADTVVNLTNHTYFNLSGHGSGEVLDQKIALAASRYTPADSTGIPTGEIADVAGTPMDLRGFAPIGAQIRDDFPQLSQFSGYDHNFVVDGEPGTLRPFAKAKSESTGIVLTAETDQPGVQFYTANTTSPRPGKDGAAYGPWHGFCLETQRFPDSPNQPAFPSAVLRAGEEYRHTTRFTFTAE